MNRDLIRHSPEAAIDDPNIMKMLQKDAKKGLEDLFHFDKYVLNYSNMEEIPHRELCDFIQNGWKTPSFPEGRNKKLILLPRGSFKSSVATIGYSLLNVVLNANIRILLASEKLSNAQKFLGEIKGHIERNEYFRLLYGIMDDRKDDVTWNSNEIVVSTRNKNLKEPTISTAGIEVTKVSMHYDLIIVDDPISNINTANKEQIDKVFAWYRLLLSLLEPGGRLIIIGTRWDYADLYGTLQEKPHVDMFDVLVRKAEEVVINEKTGEEEIKLFFPTRLTREFLDEQKKIQGGYIYSCTPGDAKVLISDWSQKRIDCIKVGDEVVGWNIGTRHFKSRLKPSKVIAVGSREAEIVKITLKSGKTVRCTSDHKWYVNPSGVHKERYFPAKVGRDLMVMGDLTEKRRDEWLGGIFDIEVCDEIEKRLTKYGFKWNYNDNGSVYWINGGLMERFRFLRIANPVRKSRILKTLFIPDFIQKKDKVVKIESDGIDTVYSMQTETGNYISQGVLSRNCQYQNEPVADEDATFRPEWYRYYIDDDLKHINMTKFMCLDPAISLEKAADYSVFIIAGVDYENKLYILHIDRGKYEPSELIKKIFEYYDRYSIEAFGLETVAFQKTLKYQINDEMNVKKRAINLIELKANTNVAKDDRIRGLQPRYEQGTIIHRKNDEMTGELEFELEHFPRGKTDDIIDAEASLLEIIYTPRKNKNEDEKEKRPKPISKITRW